MKIILFTDGSKIKVEDVVAEKISERILSQEGARQWQVFTDISRPGFYLTLNLSHINCIYSHESII